MHVDYLVVGSGLTGATIARLLADAGRDVLVLERRSHLGGNVYDFVHESGIRIHAYGPHYFRTSSERIWQFVNRFSPFHRFEAVVMTSVHGRLENWPVSRTYIRNTVGHEWKVAFRGTPSNFEEASLALMPRVVYETFVKDYTEKQWGVPASQLSVDLARRFDVRDNADRRLTRHRWQGIPTNGYATFIAELLRGIPVLLNCDYLLHGGDFHARQCVVYTGPIDEFFGFDLGRLAYRAQRREVVYEANKQFEQPVVQVNNPCRSDGPHVRTIEWKHLMPSDFAHRIQGTVLTRETPFTPICANDYEYPFPEERNRRLYNEYRQRADALRNTIIAGRLGEYRYYDMDQAIARAMVIAKRRLGV